MACNYSEIKYWLENNRVWNNDIEPQKSLVCFKTYRADV